MDCFHPLLQVEVEKIINTSPSKSCDLDPIPTTLLKVILPSVITILTEIINKSLTSGIFPDRLKVTLVRPLLKKANLDLIEINYRPISNIEFIGKCIERAVMAQINRHITSHNLIEPHQSTYQPCQSTKTALLKVKSDLISAVGNQEIACLILLALSAAFNTIDTGILLQRLINMFGITGTVKTWIASYLTDQSLKIKIGSSESSSVILECGVPQDLVLGPILFILYTTPLGQSCRKHGIHYHLYTDDSQLYMTFKPSKPGSKEACLHQLEGCISDIRLWMANNMLKLNNDKTEFIIFGTHQQLAKTSDISIKGGSMEIHPVDEVRNLGFFMDRFLKNSVHINKLSSAMLHNLWNIKKIWNKLDFDSTKSLIQALIMSKLDYCNALLPGSSKFLLTKLQHIQNMACRIVCSLKKFEHVTQPMYDLHWLHIQERIDYKIACIMYKCCDGTAPKYLMDLLPKG